MYHRPPFHWKFPQGGLEGAEGWRAAALREAQEETGVQQARLTRESRDYHHYEYPAGSRYMPDYRGQRFKWFMAETSKEELDPARFAPAHEGPEFSRLQWVKPAEALPLLHNEREGDAVTRQRQTMIANVMREFGLLPNPAIAQSPKRTRRNELLR